MLIGIDIDNTLWNLSETTINILNNRYDLNVKHEECEYDLLKTFRKYVSIDNELMEYLYKQAAYFAIPYDYSIDVINWLAENNDVIFITSSGLDELEIKDTRLKRLFEWYNTNKLYRATNKQCFTLDVIIDDLERHFSKNQKVHILFEQPYNKRINNVDYKTNDWNKIKDYIKSLM